MSGIATTSARSYPTRKRPGKSPPRYAGESLRDLDGDLRPGDDWMLDVQSETGARVFQILIRASGG